MPPKTADVMASDVDSYIAKAKAALELTEAFKDRLKTDGDFARLWNEDSAAALREMGIDPEARQEVGYPPYIQGPECEWCITPKGNACHC